MARNLLSSLSASREGNLHGYCLPRGVVSLAVYALRDTPGYRMEVGEVKLEPDPAHHYYFRYSPSPFTDDEIKLEFHPQGFLKRIYTAIDDQRDELLGKLVDIGAMVAQVAAGVPAIRTRQVAPGGERLLFQGAFDPFDEDDLAEINAYLKQQGAEAKLKVERPKGYPSSERQGNAPTLNETNRAGIYCKPMTTLRLIVEDAKSRSSATVRLPDSENLQLIEIPQATWVKTEFTMDCNEAGYPVSIHIKKPSTAMAAVELPLRILQAVIALPAQLVQLRVNWRSQQTTDTQGALAYQETMQSLNAKVEEMAKTRSTESPGNGAATRREGGAVASGEVDDLRDQVRFLEQELKTLQRRWHNEQNS